MRDAGSAATATLSRFPSIRSDYFDAIRALGASYGNLFSLGGRFFLVRLQDFAWLQAHVETPFAAHVEYFSLAAAETE